MVKKRTIDIYIASVLLFVNTTLVCILVMHMLHITATWNALNELQNRAIVVNLNSKVTGYVKLLIISASWELLTLLDSGRLNRRPFRLQCIFYFGQWPPDPVTSDFMAVWTSGLMSRCPLGGGLMSGWPFDQWPVGKWPFDQWPFDPWPFGKWLLVSDFVASGLWPFGRSLARDCRPPMWI